MMQMKPMKITRTLTAMTLLALALTGCANRGLYQWGNYDEMMYQSYKKPETRDAMRVKMEAHTAALEKSHAKVPPGMYAEIGTLWMQAGDRSHAKVFYEKERDAWPESRGLMDSLIAAMDRSPETHQEAKQ